jgi:hypothetical protein
MTTTPFIAFDIETKPLPEIAAKLFKPSSRLKDPAKIAEAKADFISEAALSPLTGSIIVIGLIDQDAKVEYLEGTESVILTAFWKRFEAHAEAVTKFCCWSGSGAAGKIFDADFIVTRSRILGVRIPPTVRNGRFYGSRIVDLASEFLLYQTDAYLSLTKAAMLMGMYDDASLSLTPKSDTDEVKGENFHRHYAENPAKALPYLANDLLHTYHLARRILA